METLSVVLTEAQQHASFHKGGVKKLSGLFGKVSGDQAAELMETILRGCVDKYMLVSKKDANMDRLSKFFCEFLVSSSMYASDAVFRQGVEHLLKRSLAGDKTVRYKACQNFATVIMNMNGDAEISDELWEQITETLTPRLRDKAPNVRMWAIKALGRLQNSESEKDEITLEIQRLMESDTSDAVRVAAVDNIAVAMHTLNSIVSRVRDVKKEVRVAALERLMNNVNVSNLSSSMRAMIVTHTLNDREKAVKTAAVALVTNWCATLDYKVPKLLNLMNMGSNQEVTTMVANTLIGLVETPAEYNVQAPPALREIVRHSCPKWDGSISSIPPSEILWAQLRCEYARKHFQTAVAEEVLESLIPDTVVLCQLLAEAHALPSLYTKKSAQLTVRYLLRMTNFMESTDVSGGLELTKVCEAMLIDVRFPDKVVDDVLDAWLRGLGKTDSLTIFESITALSEKFAAILEATDAEELELDEGALEIMKATRGLQLVAWALTKSVGDASATTRLSETFAPFALEALQSTAPEMRMLAVQCLGLMGLASEQICGDHRDIIFQVAFNDIEAPLIRDTALKALTDMATVHPNKFMNHPTLINLLIRVQNDETDTLSRVNAANASAKLLFAGTLSEPRLFGFLMKFFFMPDQLTGVQGTGSADEDENVQVTEAVASLQQVLSVFFQIFFVAGQSREQVAWGAISDIMADVVALSRDGEAPPSAVGKIAMQLLGMCEHVAKRPSAASEQLDVAETSRVAVRARLCAVACRELLKLGNSKPEKAVMKELVKLVGNLEPSSWATNAMAKVVSKCARCVVKNCTSLDKASSTIMGDFIDACDGMMREEEARIEALLSEEQQEEIGDEERTARAYAREEQAQTEVQTFYDLSMGLADLVEMGADQSDEEEYKQKSSAMRKKVVRNVRAVSKRRKLAQGDTDEEEDEAEAEEEEEPVKAAGKKRAAPAPKKTSKAAPAKTTRTATRTSSRRTVNYAKLAGNDDDEDEFIDAENANPQEV